MPQVKVNHIPLEERVSTFNTVEVGYTKEEAIEEASRCLNCKNPRCVMGCPIHNNIPQFIQKIKEDKLDEANAILRITSGFSHICSYVCYSENQCMKDCIRGIKDEPLNIRLLERYVSDNSKVSLEKKANNSQVKVCVIGAGPASLAFSKMLLENGYDVTMFDNHPLLGGVLRYGIPRYRLPIESLDKEVFEQTTLGLKYIEKEIKSYEEVKDFDYIYIGVGTSKCKKLRIDGEDSSLSIDWTDYLKDPLSYDMKGKHVCVVGGGNVAIDCARTLIRQGAKCTICYRRTVKEMPCNQKELIDALEEGLEVVELHNPIQIIDNGSNLTVVNAKMELGEMDESGRRSPVDTNVRCNFEFDYIMKAIGSQTLSPIEGLTLDRWYNIAVDENFKTNLDKVYAFGDCVTGATTVVGAIKSAKDAAKVFLEKLNK